MEPGSNERKEPSEGSKGHIKTEGLPSGGGSSPWSSQNQPTSHSKTVSMPSLYAYKHYILILSDSSEQAEGFLDDIKTELEDNANIIMDFGSLKGDKAWRTGVILTKTDIKAEAIGSGKKVRGRRHRNWRPDLIVLDDIENDENVNTPEQRR